MGFNWTKPPVGTPIDWSSPFARGLVTCLPMWEGTGRTLRDVAGGRNDAVIQYDAAWGGSPHGPAVTFDGSAGHYAIIGSGNPSNIAIGAGTPHTIAILFRLDPLPGGTGFGRVLGLMAAQDSPFNKLASVELYNISGSTVVLQAEFYDGVANPFVRDTFPLIGTGWHSVVWTFDGASMSLYRDGGLVSQSSYTTGTTDAAGTAWYLGNRPDSFTDPLPGGLSMALIANRPWSAQEVATWSGNPWQLFQSTSPWYLIEHATAVPTGTGAITLGSMSAVGTGGFTASASGAITLGSIAAVGTGRFTASASGAIALGAMTVAGTGRFTASASGSITLGSMTAVGAASFATSAAGAITLGSLSVAGTGTATGATTGAGAITLGSIAVAGVGRFTSTATGAITLGPVTVAGTGVFTASASGAIALGPATAVGSGRFTASATGAITLGSIAAVGAASFATTATGAITLGSIAAAGTGTVTGLYAWPPWALFSGTAGTHLESLPADSGGTWTKHPSYSTGDMVVTAAGRVRTEAVNLNSLYIHPALAPTADYDVAADVRFVSDVNDAIGVGGRCDPTADTWYRARYRNIPASTHGFQLFKTVSGVATQLGGTYARTLTAGETARLTLRMVGTTISLLVDGVSQISVTDSSIAAAGLAGIFGFSLAGDADGTGTHLDNFNVVPASGAITLGSITVAGAGTASAPGTTTGTGAITLGSLSVVGAASFKASASGAITLGSVAVAGAGIFTAPATGAVTLGVMTVAGTGRFTATASGSVVLAGLSVAGIGTATGATAGSGAIALGSIAVAGTGRFTSTASGSIALAGIVAVGIAPGPAMGTGAITLGRLGVAGTAVSVSPVRDAYPDPFGATSTTAPFGPDPFGATSVVVATSPDPFSAKSALKGS